MNYSNYLLKGFQYLFGLFTVIMIFSFSCKSPKQQNSAGPVDPEQQKEALISTRQNIIRDETADIEGYIQSHNYTMESTPTGLRYMIYKTGPRSKPVKENSRVRFNYKVSLLDGNEIYNSDSTGAFDLIVGKSEVASGLQEGLKYLHEGDKAVFIVPSHLAYGLTGDGDKIKQYQVLVIDIDLMNVFE